MGRDANGIKKQFILVLDECNCLIRVIGQIESGPTNLPGSRDKSGSTSELLVSQTQSRGAQSIGDQVIIRILRGRPEHYADSLDVPHE
jgi:hypothetical protein